jgi:hypothetical protein
MAETDSFQEADPYQEAWRRLLGEPHRGPPLALPADARARLEDMIGAALTHHMLDGTATTPAIDATRARHSLLLNRLNRHRQVECLRHLANAGIETVAMKGFASGYTLYPDPDLRITGDLDVLVRHAEVRAAARVFLDLGFRVATEIPLAAWGFTSEASFLPIVSADEVANVDLHVEPDCYPLYRGLDASAVFAGARRIEASGLAVRIPAPEHALLIAVSNATKERFDRATIKSLLDLPRLLRARLDWPEITRRAGAARLQRPLVATLALLRVLGLPAALVPSGLADLPGALAGRLARAELARIAVEVGHFFPGAVSAADKVRREVLLTAEPAAIAYRAWLRLRGLVRPRTGDPAPADRGGLTGGPAP